MISIDADTGRSLYNDVNDVMNVYNNTFEHVTPPVRWRVTLNCTQLLINVTFIDMPTVINW